MVEAVFGHTAYQVGSSLTDKSWRDVDVRLILPDEEYAAMGFGVPDNCQSNEKWVALVRAFCALGREITGLPIDFQIQQMSDANKNPASDGPRSALCMSPSRCAQREISRMREDYNQASDLLANHQGGLPDGLISPAVERILYDANSNKA